MTDVNPSATTTRAPGNPQTADAPTTGAGTDITTSTDARPPDSQSSPTPPAPPHHHNPLTNWSVLLLGVALAMAATDPTRLAVHGPVGWLLTAFAAVAAIWAAPAVAQRPTIGSTHWAAQLARHRNSVFAVGCVIIAGFGNPPAWLTAVDAALLLAYLLTVDAFAAGPVGIGLLRHRVAPLAAAAATVVVLLAAEAPVNTGAVWGRIVAAAAVALAALAAGAALWIRRTGAQRP
jgi:hypothetical protein